MVSFVSRRGVLRISAIVLLALLLPAGLGWLQPLEQGLAAVMAARPLAKLYLVVFIVLGALLPLGVRLWRRREREPRQVLDPYLLLLLGQLISELLVVLAGGKGLGVLVGMIFTMLRLLQLPQLWPLSRGAPGLRPLLLLLGGLWGWNALQMLIWRWWPLWLQSGALQAHATRPMG